MTTLTYLGHSCFLMEIKDQTILFDPFITGNPATKGKVSLPTLTPDLIVLSHGHQDHILDAETIAKQSGCPILSNFEIVTWYEDKGIETGIPVNHGGTVDFNGVKIKMTNAVHTSSFPDGSYAGQPAGFVVSWDGGAFYYSGDTALNYDMKLIGEEFDLDFAILCLGDHFTMGASDAVKAADFVGTDKVVGMHFDTFPPIEIDHEATQALFTAAGKTLKLPIIGKSFSF